MGAEGRWAGAEGRETLPPLGRDGREVTLVRAPPRDMPPLPRDIPPPPRMPPPPRAPPPPRRCASAWLSILERVTQAPTTMIVSVFMIFLSALVTRGLG